MTGLVVRRYADIAIGDKASDSRKVTEEVVRAFADATGDFNPVHIDAEFAKTS